MSQNVPLVTATVAAAGVIGGAYYAYKAYKSKLPTKWTQVGALKEIYMYPVKSCGTVRVETAECTAMGLKNGWLRDRVLMFTDESNNFIHARIYPELLLVEPTIKSSILTLKHKDMEPIYINLAEVIEVRETTTAQVWGIPVSVYDCGNEASEWIGRLLGSTKKHRLVYYASQKCRPARKNKIFVFRENDTGALPDETSYNLINEGSVDELNTRLKNTQVSERNFRPNFLLSGAKAYEEDKWKYIKIGDNIFEIIKPCTRCILTTIDPETGIRDSYTEPLETLKSYRQYEDEKVRAALGSTPRMGVQMALRSGPSIVTLNDTIYAA